MTTCLPALHPPGVDLDDFGGRIVPIGEFLKYKTESFDKNGHCRRRQIVVIPPASSVLPTATKNDKALEDEDDEDNDPAQLCVDMMKTLSINRWMRGDKVIYGVPVTAPVNEQDRMIAASSLVELSRLSSAFRRPRVRKPIQPQDHRQDVQKKTLFKASRHKRPRVSQSIMITSDGFMCLRVPPAPTRVKKRQKTQHRQRPRLWAL